MEILGQKENFPPLAEIGPLKRDGPEIFKWHS